MAGGRDHEARPGTVSELIAAARAGSAAAVGELLECYRPYLLAVARGELPHELDAKLGPSDVVQESILRASRRFGEFAGEDEPALLGWLRRITLNQVAQAARHFRAEKRQLGREHMLKAEPPDRQPSPSSQFASLEERQRIEAALARLPEASRQVIVLRHLEDRSFSEIGTILGRSEDAAWQLWARAVRLLRKELGSDG